MIDQLTSKNQTLLKPGEPNHCKFCGSPYGDVDGMAAEIQRLRTALNDIEKLTSSQVTLHYHCRQANVIANLALAGPDDVCVHGKRRDEDCVCCPGSFQKALGHETRAPTLTGLRQGQLDFIMGVTTNAVLSGMHKEQFLHAISLAWDARASSEKASVPSGRWEGGDGFCNREFEGRHNLPTGDRHCNMCGAEWIAENGSSPHD